MPTQSVLITHAVGLHATPLAQFVSKARAFPDTTVRVRRGEREADGKGLISMLGLEALNGTTIDIITDGPHAEEVLALLVALVSKG